MKRPPTPFSCGRWMVETRSAFRSTNFRAAAWNLGASQWRALREVILPFTLPAILSALFITMAVSFDEFAIAWFVSGFNETLPVRILAMFQGRRFTVGASGASLNAPGNTQTADQIKTEVAKPGGIGSGSDYYDPTAFAPVTEVRFGTVGRNTMRSPGVVNMDFSVFRKFPIKESVNLEFRAEAFNLSNTPHFLTPGSNINSGNFMQVAGAQQDQRQLRFGLRLEF